MRTITKIEYDSAREYIEHVFGVSLSDVPKKEVFFPVFDEVSRRIGGHKVIFVKIMSEGGKHDNKIAERIAESWNKKGRYFHWNSHDKGPGRRSFYVEDKLIPSDESFTIKQPRPRADGPGARLRRLAKKVA